MANSYYTQPIRDIRKISRHPQAVSGEFGQKTREIFLFDGYKIE